MLGRVMLVMLCGLGFSANVFSQTADVFPGKTWEIARKEEAANWSDAKLAAVDDYARTLQTSSYIVVQHGRIIHEYGDTARPINLQSMRRSVMSVLTGIYVDRGVIGLDSTLAQLGIDDKGGLSGTEKQATLKQLLQGRSGVYHPGALEAIRFAGPRPQRDSFKPGEHFYYNNWDFNAVGLAFSKLTGKTVFESLHDDLAVPLQMESDNPVTDGSWVREDVSDIPAYVLRLSARDMVRVGLLMSRQGAWNGKQLVSKSWVAESTTSYSEFSPGYLGFGYIWFVGLDHTHVSTKFLGHPRFAAIGSNGQEMIVVPDLDLVIVHNVDNERFPEGNVTDPQLGKLVGMILEAMN